jgi:hypothetical protein
MGFCCICGNSINQKELQQNFLLQIRDFLIGKFHAEATFYYHKRCVSKVLKKDIVFNN